MLLTNTGFDPAKIALNETLFHTANGYLGVRACLEEGVPEDIRSVRGAYLNAFYETKPMVYPERLYGFPQEQETLVNMPDVQTIRVAVCGEPLSLFSGGVLDHSQKLDMSAGMAVRAWRVRTAYGFTFELETRRMASLAEPSLFMMRFAVRSLEYSGPLTFDSTMDGCVGPYANPRDPRVAQDAQRHLDVTEAVLEPDGIAILCCQTLRSGLHMACGARHFVRAPHTADAKLTPQSVWETFTCNVMPGEEIVLEKWCAFADSRRHADPRAAALTTLRECSALGPWELWERRQREYLDGFWKTSRVRVMGDEALQTAVDYSMYQLLQSTGQDGLSGTAAKGLSGEGYEGHAFWDTEIYIFPFFLLTDPRRAQKLLAYRYGLLGAARMHARAMGHDSGALYPWRTIAGRECSGYFPAGSAQYHINGDVAYAFTQYWRLTGDLSFMEEMGAEVLIETARLWIDIGHLRDGEFRIDGVTGPDEYTCMVNNNYYTNLCARGNLLAAADVYMALEQSGRLKALRQKTGVTAVEIGAFRAAADRMRLPYDPKRGIFAQDDSFLWKKPLDPAALPADRFPLLLHYHPLYLYRHQVCKQADAVMAHFLYEEGVEEVDMRRTYDYYEQITTHDSSLSPCVFGIMAARLGNLSKAMNYFRMTARMDLDDTHGNTADGIHTANLGGVYLGLVMGFAGLRVTRAGVSLRPRVPESIEGYAFSFCVENSRIWLEMCRSGPTLRLEEGEPVTLTVDGREVALEG